MRHINKDITTVTSGLILHGVNCQGKMASGVALAIRTKWPAVYKSYMESYNYMKSKNFLWLGRAFPGYIDIANELVVFNGFTQEYYGRDGRAYATVEAIQSCLEDVYKFAIESGITDIYIPRIGCNLGGLNWDQVGPMIEEFETSKNGLINITVCDFNT